jgi:hypothetical protein
MDFASFSVGLDALKPFDGPSLAGVDGRVAHRILFES